MTQAINSYNVLIDRFQSFANGHYLINAFTHGILPAIDESKDKQYPWMHVTCEQVVQNNGQAAFSWIVYFFDLPRDKDNAHEYKREALSDCIRLAQDLIYEIENGNTLFGKDIDLQDGATMIPGMDEYTHTLTGVQLSFTLVVPDDYDACAIPADYAVGAGPGSTTPGVGSLSFIESLNNTDGLVSLDNDQENPGNTMYYGTDASGVKGWYSMSGGGGGVQSVTGNAVDNTDPVNPVVTAVTSVGLTMPSAFNVANSPVTGSDTIAVTGAGLTTQYVRGDGSLANFPSSTGGGASVSYYLNGGTNQGSFGGVTYYEMNRTPVIGIGVNFTINANGYIASFITDANDPSLINIPGGNWNFEMYFSASSGGGNPNFYVELYKYDGATFTLIASSSAAPEGITNGTVTDLYTTALAVPTTTLALTDRLAVRIYVNHSSKTITLHTQDNTLCQIITTFTTGLTALNGLTDQVQTFATGITGTDFAISSASGTHTFNLPVASGSNTGKLSNTDWTTFNNKVSSVGATGPITSSGGNTPTISTSMATNRLIGRTTAGTGVMEEISVGTGLTLSGGSLSNSDPASGVTLASSGGTQTLVNDGSGPSLAVKGLTAGNGISLTGSGTDVTITNSSPASGVTLTSAGGTETLVNDGTGPAIATKGLTAGTGISLSGAATAVTITNSSPASSVTLTSAGGTETLVNDGTGPAIATKGLTAGTGITLTGAASSVTIANSGVTSVGATAPITSSGGATPTISTSMATSRIIGRTTAGTGVMEELTLSQVLDLVGSSAQGDILYRGASGWERLAAGTSGQVLQTNGASSNPSWVETWKEVTWGSDVSTTSTANQDITGASFSLATNSTYIVEFSLRLGSSATNGMGLGFSLPTGATGDFIAMSRTNTDTAQVFVSTQFTGDTTSATAYATQIVTTACATWSVKVVTASTAGTFQLRFASKNVANTATIYYLASYMKYKKIA